MYLFFDTETNGFPPHANMTQLAFVLTDKQGNIIQEFQSIIKPKNWIVKDKAWYLANGYNEKDAQEKGGFFTDNNISTERCEKEGIDVFIALRKFQDALKKCEYKVAHNISFDNKIVYKEIVDNGITKELFQFKKNLCTMMNSTQYVGAINKWGKPGKWPTLSELHIKLFGEDFTGAHDALDDVKAMVKCFFKMQEIGIIPKH
jgi:DNA polymerase III subunit epsilon